MMNEIQALLDGYVAWLRDRTTLRQVNDWIEITTIRSSKVPENTWLTFPENHKGPPNGTQLTTTMMTSVHTFVGANVAAPGASWRYANVEEESSERLRSVQYKAIASPIYLDDLYIEGEVRNSRDMDRGTEEEAADIRVNPFDQAYPTIHWPSDKTGAFCWWVQ